MGKTHEQANKDYLAAKIAEEIAKKILKVNIYGYDMWYPYTIEVKEKQPYVEWPYVVCEPFTLDILTNMGYAAGEVDFIQIDMDIKVAWDPGRPSDDSWYPKTIPAGATFKLENKHIEKLYIHAQGTGFILIEVEGSSDC